MDTYLSTPPLLICQNWRAIRDLFIDRLIGIDARLGFVEQNYHCRFANTFLYRLAEVQAAFPQDLWFDRLTMVLIFYMENFETTHVKVEICAKFVSSG